MAFRLCVCVCVCVCARAHMLSRVQLFATPWTIAHQLLYPWKFWARVLELVAISYSRGSSQPMNWAHISCMGRQILYPYAFKEAQVISTRYYFSQVCVLEHFLRWGWWAEHMFQQQGWGWGTSDLLDSAHRSTRDPLDDFLRHWLSTTPQVPSLVKAT